MKKEDCALIGLFVGAFAMLTLLIFLYQGTTARKIDIEAYKAKHVCEATLPRNISCEIVITAVPKLEVNNESE